MSNPELKILQFEGGSTVAVKFSAFCQRLRDMEVPPPTVHSREKVVDITRWLGNQKLPPKKIMEVNSFLLSIGGCIKA
jgi:hypothetical protein